MNPSEPTPPGTDLKVGELAQRTGLSVRALHHYDEIGLLRPSRRTAAGHRLYSGADVARLWRIRALQQLDFSLEEIRGVLDDRERFAPSQVLSLRLARLREQIDAAERLRGRLEGLLRRLDEDDSVGAFLEATYEMSKFEQYYTPEQLSELQRRHDAMDPAELKSVEAEWPELIAAMRRAQAEGKPADDPDVQRMAARWEELISQFTGGDPGIRESLGKMYAREPGMGEDHGLDAELMRFVAEAQRTRGS